MTDASGDPRTARRRFVIHGRVQGVFFRASAREEAVRLGLAGQVRNQEDGTVELEAQGPQSALDALEAWCRRGPPGARVERVVVEQAVVSAGASGFQIVR